MKKIIGLVICFMFLFQAMPLANAAEKTNAQILNEHFKELYASDLAYIDNVYKNKNKKVKEIAGVGSEIKDAIGEWTVVNVSENGGSITKGFEAIIIESPGSTNNYIIAYKGSAGTLADKDWVDNQVALDNINTDKTQLNGLVYHPQDEEAVTFTKNFLAYQKNSHIVLTGHSLGGHLAQYVKIKLNLLDTKVVTFNSLGVVTNSKQANYESFINGTINFIIDGEIIDLYGKRFAITNLGTNPLVINGNYDMTEKHKLVRFYSFISKTYTVYQNNKPIVSFYNLDNAKQLASVKTKTTIKDNSHNSKVIWESKFAVYYHQRFISSFNDRKSSDTFAKKQLGRRVLDLKTNKNVYFNSNATFRFSVYLGKDKLDIFTTSSEAIKFAKLNKNRIVKDEKTKKIIYPLKK